MSCSRFHFTFSSYGDVHGLVFETSICYWQDQPDSRFLSPAEAPDSLNGRNSLGLVRSILDPTQSTRIEAHPWTDASVSTDPSGSRNASVSRFTRGYYGILADHEVTKRTAADSGTVRGDKLDDHFPVESRRHQTFRSVVVFG